MRFLSIFLIVFGVIVIVFPKFLSILIWSFFVFVWVNLGFIGFQFWKAKNKWKKEDYVKFWKYKIYR